MEEKAADRKAAEQQNTANALMASSLSQAFMAHLLLSWSGTLLGSCRNDKYRRWRKSYLETFDALARRSKGKASP